MKTITEILFNAMKKTALAFCFIAFVVNANAQSNAVSYTLDDRDRMIRVEVEQKALRNEMNVKFEAMNVKFEAMNMKFEAMDSKIQVLYWGFGIMITLMLFLFGYIVLDRKTGLKPLEKQVSEIKISNEKIISIIKERAKTDNAFKELLKHVAL